MYSAVWHYLRSGRQCASGGVNAQPLCLVRTALDLF